MERRYVAGVDRELRFNPDTRTAQFRLGEDTKWYDWNFQNEDEILNAIKDAEDTIKTLRTLLADREKPVAKNEDLSENPPEVYNNAGYWIVFFDQDQKVRIKRVHLLDSIGDALKDVESDRPISFKHLKDRCDWLSHDEVLVVCGMQVNLAFERTFKVEKV